MAINNASFPILSPEQANPVLTGMQRSQELQKLIQDTIAQKLHNQKMQAIMQYIGPQAQAELYKQQLANRLSEGQNPSLISEEQSKAISSNLGLNQAAFKSALIKQIAQEKGLNLGGAPDQSQSQQIPNAGLPMSQAIRQKLAANLQAGGMQGQEAQEIPGGIDADNLSPGEQAQAERIANAPIYPAQGNEAPSHADMVSQQVKKLQDEAQEYQMAGLPGSEAKLKVADQLMHGTFQQQRQILTDQEKIQDYKDMGALASNGTYFLNDFDRLLKKAGDELFYPGIRKISNWTQDDYQSLRRDAQYMAASLPHLLGVSPKGINQHLEDNLRALAGDPEGQVKNTLVHDSQLLRELFERGLLTGSLWEGHLKKNGDLKTYSAFNGDLMKHFESKAEFKSWLAKQSPEVQKAAYSQFQKSKGQK